MQKKVSIYVESFLSKKGTKCVALCADLGYTKKYLTFDQSIIAEVLYIPVADVYDLEVGKTILIAQSGVEK